MTEHAYLSTYLIVLHNTTFKSTEFRSKYLPNPIMSVHVLEYKALIIIKATLGSI